MTHIAKKTLRHNGKTVKAQIILAGVAMGELADAAGVHQSTLSNCLAGRSRNLAMQIKLWRAFAKLSGSRATLREFWGDLLNDEVGAAVITTKTPSKKLSKAGRSACEKCPKPQETKP